MGGIRRSALGADVRWRSSALESALLRFFDTVIPHDQEISGALEEILTLLRNTEKGHLGRRGGGSCQSSRVKPNRVS